MAKPPRRRTAIDPTVPFTRAEARAAGVRLRDLLGPGYRKVFFDLYVSAATPITAAVRAKAALKISGEGSFASHHTAAELWGGCVPHQPLTHVAVPKGRSRSERRGITAHVANSAAQVVSLAGLPVSSPAQTFLDLAGLLNLVDLVVLGDSLVKARHTTPRQLVSTAEAWDGHGARVARRAARLVRSGVDSPMETRLRVLIVLAGLPEPVVNFVLRNEDGEWVMRFDLSYPDLKLAIEYDGRQHAYSNAQWAKDISRRELLDRLGWRLIVIRSDGIYVEPRATLDRVIAAMRECGARSIRPRPTTEWRQHFPGRSWAA